MLIKLFVLGRPGSGKTTAFYRIKERAEEMGWSSDRIRDYEILRNMFQHDVESKKFRATNHNGFDVIDFSVLDTALLEVERLVKLRMLTAKGNELIVAEFARDDYSTALEIFSPDFLQDTHILFVDADVDTCIQRIHQRIADGLAPDKHFVSDTVLKGYYGKDNSSYMRYLTNLSTNSRGQAQSGGGVVQYVKNSDSLEVFQNEIDHFFDEIVAQITSNIPSSSTSYKQYTDEPQSDLAVQAL